MQNQNTNSHQYSESEVREITSKAIEIAMKGKPKKSVTNRLLNEGYMEVREFCKQEGIKYITHFNWLKSNIITAKKLGAKKYVKYVE